MKLRHFVFIAAATALLIPVGFASADQVGDPSVIINRSPSDATPFTGSFNVMLDDDGGADVVFQNALSFDITELIIQFQVPLPTGVNTCSSTIFKTCGVQDISFNTKTGFLTEDFVFGGGGLISPSEDFSFSAAGFVGANPNVNISLPTPEPGTIVLLLTGGLLIIGLGRRWQ